MKREVQIASDVWVSADLAQRLGHWSEFQSGSGCDIDLYNVYTHERVQVRYKDGDNQLTVISVFSEQPGSLFDRVLGQIVFSLSCEEGNLIVKRSN